MNPATILLGLFDWRGVLTKAAHRRNLSILVLVDLLIGRLDILSGPASCRLDGARDRDGPFLRRPALS